MSEKKESISPPGIDKERERIYFDYIKSNYFRTVYVNGIFGGLSPQGDVINMSVYTERWPLPKQVVHKLENSLCKDEIREERITRNAIVREIDVNLVITIEQAISMKEWLEEKISEHKKETQEQDKEDKDS